MTRLFAPSFSSPQQMNSRQNIFQPSLVKTKGVIILSLLVFSLVNLMIVLVNHYFFRTYALDYGVYNFAFFDYAHFRMSPCPAYIYPAPVTFFQDHFSLTLLLLSPLYWLLSPVTGTYSLLIIQWGFIVAGAWATYKLIALKANHHVLGLLAMVYYFLLLGRYNAYREDANLAIIGSAFVPVFLYYFEQKKLIPTLVCFALLLVNREDYSLWLFFICLFLALVNRKDKHTRKLALILMIASVIFFIVIFKVIFPAIEDENKKFSLFDFSIVGESPLQALLFVISHPLKAIEFLFINHSDNGYYNGIKTQFYLVYFISGGFVLLLRPHYLIPFIPLIAKKMYDDNPLRWGIDTYYSIEIVSILPLMVFSILAKFKSKSLKKVLAIAICFLSLGVTTYRLFTPTVNPILAPDKKSNFLSASFYNADCDVSALNKTLQVIPSDAAVCASGKILPHLAFREKIYYFPLLKDAEYICVFKKEDTYPLMPDAFEAELNKLRSDSTWFVLKENSDVVLFSSRKK